MLVVDRTGVPLGMQLASAQRAEVTLALSTLNTIHVPRPKGRAKCHLDALTADKAYDSGDFRRALRHRSTDPRIPTRSRPRTWKRKPGRPPTATWPQYRERWVVERTFAWLGHFRRILIRWEHKLPNFQAFVLFALTLLVLRRILK